MLDWELGPITTVPLEALSETLGYLRLPRPQLESRLRRSLEQDGQLTPLVAAPQGTSYEVIDGFKRVRAARQSARLPRLSVRPLVAEAAQLKVAIILLNRPGAGLSALEESWVIRALIREEGLTQLQVADIFARHQSWVSRRLSLAEGLSESLQEDVRLGLLTPVSARMLVRMPRGIQQSFWESIRQEGLSSREHERLARLVVQAHPERREFLLANPREALKQEQASEPVKTDPRLSGTAANLSSQMQVLGLQAGRLRSRLACLDHSGPRPLERTILGQEAHRLQQNLGTLIEELCHFGAVMAQPPSLGPLRCDTTPEKSSTTLS